MLVVVGGESKSRGRGREGREGGKVKGPRIGPAGKIEFNFILLRYEEKSQPYRERVRI